MFAGSLTAKGELVSVGSEPGFSLECVCMPGRPGAGGCGVKRCFPCCGAGGVPTGPLTAKGEPVPVGSEPGFPLECAYACPAGRVRAVTV